MPDYDFRSLSGHDFALLARDLIQAELGFRLESFSAGPDSGIDFRYKDDGTNLIVQCKHYAESGFSSLASVMRRKERKKIDNLRPTRYILATSVSLTPRNKDELLSGLTPHCLGVSDIYGREDLNNLLGQHSDVERRHFKLWLTSESVLRRVLEAGIFSDSEAHLDRVRRRLCRYVQNPSFHRARSLLDKSHYCIIAGIPGIGKTTLAEVLLADLVDRQGFEAFRIVHSLDEIRPVKNTRNRQVFYFDDFLGKTGLDKLQANDDQRLIELIEEVTSNENWRFILATREYILNSAKFRYEAIAHASADFKLCVIKLDDYTRPIRARILYNHIYFSDVPKTHKLALLQDRAYEGILQHRNYSPRVIEYMTQGQHASSLAPSLYVREFIDSLDHPTRIWDHAFRHQISEAGRHLLLVLSTLPDDSLLEDVENAFWRFYGYRRERFGFAMTSEDWKKSVKELEGSFVATRNIGKDIVISFHNPSVRDFLEHFLAHSEGDVIDLIRGAHFYEQYVSLWRGRGGHRYSGVDRDRDEYLRRLHASIFGPTSATYRSVSTKGDAIGLGHFDVSAESRLEFAVRVTRELNSQIGSELLDVSVSQLEKRWEQGKAHREDLARLLQLLTEHGLRRSDKIFVAARTCLTKDVEEMSHYRAIARFAKDFQGLSRRTFGRGGAAAARRVPAVCG